MSPTRGAYGNCPKRCGGTLIRTETMEPIDKTGIWTYEKRKVVIYQCNVCGYREDQQGTPA